MAPLTESTVESAALAWLEAIGWRVAHGPNVAPPCPPADRDMPAAERGGKDEHEVTRDIEFFNLDTILSVGYRIPPSVAKHPQDG